MNRSSLLCGCVTISHPQHHDCFFCQIPFYIISPTSANISHPQYPDSFGQKPLYKTLSTSAMHECADSRLGFQRKCVGRATAVRQNL